MGGDDKLVLPHKRSGHWQSFAMLGAHETDRGRPRRTSRTMIVGSGHRSACPERAPTASGRPSTGARRSPCVTSARDGPNRTAAAGPRPDYRARDIGSRRSPRSARIYGTSLALTDELVSDACSRTVSHTTHSYGPLLRRLGTAWRGRWSWEGRRWTSRTSPRHGAVPTQVAATSVCPLWSPGCFVAIAVAAEGRLERACTHSPPPNNGCLGPFQQRHRRSRRVAPIR